MSSRACSGETHVIYGMIDRICVKILNTLNTVQTVHLLNKEWTSNLSIISPSSSSSTHSFSRFPSKCRVRCCREGPTCLSSPRYPSLFDLSETLMILQYNQINCLTCQMKKNTIST